MSEAKAFESLRRAIAVLPLSDEELIYKGIAAAVSERLTTLKKARERLESKYGSREALEARIQSEGVPPEDHTLYTDLLEWRAIEHEWTELLQTIAGM